MKKLIWVFTLIMLFGSFCFAERLFKVEENFRYPSMRVKDNSVYLFNRMSYVFHRYNKETGKLINTFGKKGEGPGEFKMNVSWNFVGNKLVVGSQGKVSYFSLDGVLEKELTLQTNMLSIHGIGKSVVTSFVEIPKDGRGRGSRFIIVDPVTKKRTIIARFSPRDRIYFRKNMPKQKFYMIRSYPQFKSNGNQVAVGHPFEGFKFSFYDETGKRTGEFNYPYKKVKIPDTEKKRRMNAYIKQLGKERYKSMKERFNFVFPEYYPPFYNFKIGTSHLYITTYHLSENRKQRELMVMDFKGKLLKTRFVPNETYSINNGVYYYIVENEEDENWELHAITL